MIFLAPLLLAQATKPAITVSCFLLKPGVRMRMQPSRKETNPEVVEMPWKTVGDWLEIEGRNGRIDSSPVVKALDGSPAKLALTSKTAESSVEVLPKVADDKIELTVHLLRKADGKTTLDRSADLKVGAGNVLVLFAPAGKLQRDREVLAVFRPQS